MQSPPISQAEIEARISDHLDELLLWRAEQGSSKPRDLELMASVIPAPRGEAVRVLDLYCGPGDAGRAIRRIYPKAQIDCIDRDPFLTAICKGINRRDGIPGRIIVQPVMTSWQSSTPFTGSRLRERSSCSERCTWLCAAEEYSCWPSRPVPKNLSQRDSRSGRPGSLSVIYKKTGSVSGREPTTFSATIISACLVPGTTIASGTA